MIQNTTTYFIHSELPGMSRFVMVSNCKSLRFRFSLLVFLFFCNVAAAFSQTMFHEPGKLLVSIHTDSNAIDLCRRFNALHPETTLSCEKKVSDLLNTWMFTCDAGAPSEQQALRWLQVQPEIRFVQYDYKVDLRRSAIDSLIPDDPLFFQQWQYLNTGATGGQPNADLDAPQAWNFTTGGISSAYDTVVIAVIDGGVDYLHADLSSNLWKNHAEIPNDGIDNDYNGYTDDFRGWNVWTVSDHIGTWNNTHGTPVCGVIGARGNNGTGVSGVNWKVKIMFVASAGFLSNILESFDYVYKARKRYNESQGQQGAFVVAVNCSWGIDYGNPDDAPLLCAMFDTLGHEGILSIASTANLPINVDVDGDLPTTCPSPYLISVTSLQSDDNLAPNAAWGPLNIDLGAYGNNIFTTADGNNYGSFSGTSFAAPHVSGAVGLAYASDCPDLISLAKADPQAGALMAKAILLNNTVYNDDLDGKVLTSGRLNLGTFAEQQETGCSTCPPPFDIKVENAEATSVSLRWLQLPGQTNAVLRWKKATDSLWQYILNASIPWTLSGLDTCTAYTIGLNINCGGENSGWSYDRVFSTNGCCLAPEGLEISDVTSGGAAINWITEAGSGTYVVSWMENGGYAWNDTTLDTSGMVLLGLSPCTEYLVKVGVQCDGADSVIYAPFTTFSTLGCGTCTDLPYCSAGAQSSIYDWIVSVTLNGWTHDSGNGGPGYQDFTEGLPGTAIIPVGTVFDLTLSPGFWGNPSKVYFRVYLDLNANGSFDDPGELLYDPGYSTYSSLNTTLLIPNGTVSLKTRLRVVMKYMGTFDTIPGPCETFGYGQVEDYCVQVGELNTGLFSDPGHIKGKLQTWPVPASNELWFNMPESETGCSKLALDILDANGMRVLQKKFTPSEHKNGKVRIDTAAWKPGVYTLRLMDRERVFLGKAVKM